MLSPKRKGRLTASAFSAAIGINPYQSRQQLWRVMMGIEPPFEGNEATQYGNDHEPFAVDAYEAEMGAILDKSSDKQEFFIHPEHNWLGCTPDGFNGDIVVEIKCPFRGELYPDVPCYYMPQIQGQMMITGAKECHFVCWTPDELAVWGVPSREDYQDHLFQLLDDYWQCVQQEQEPMRRKKPQLPKVTTDRII